MNGKPEDIDKSKYNNWLIAKQMLMWRRKGRREKRAWLSCKQQAGHGCVCNSGSIH
jgi:hypothetical protein